MMKYILLILLMVTGPALAQDHAMEVEAALEAPEDMIEHAVEAVVDPAVKVIEDSDLKKAEPKSHDITVINNKGDDIGMVKIRKATEGVLLNFILRDLPTGYHGMHFHSVGDCSDLESFKTAGGHIVPEGKPHGFLNADGPHAGNLPNLIVGKDGTAEVELYSNLVTYDEGSSALFDDDGSTLIIHTNIDDHMTQPIGGAGGRIACGAIKNENLETDTLSKEEK